MKRSFKYLVPIIISVFLLSLPVAAEVKFGGEVKTGFTATSVENSGFYYDLYEQLKLEIFVPETGNTEARIEADFTVPGGPGFKKLYLKHRFKEMDLTIGRQPVSWSFGSLVNPVDYSLGAEAMNEEGSAKYVDGIEAFIPLNWNSNISLVSSFPGTSFDSDRVKFGLRGRTLINNNFDVSANYVQDQYKDTFDTIIDRRFGVTVKGDLDPLGIYGAFGYYSDDNGESDLAYLAGCDYSFLRNNNNRVYLQGEVLRVKKQRVSDMLHEMPLNISNADEELTLLFGNASYGINQFSEAGLMTAYCLNDGGLALMPRYQNQLGSNLTMELKGLFTLASDQALFYSDFYNSVVGVELSYPF
ncbi:hypothetical protein [Halothermothrix orenii]|nr:hypothetical protein [Halothermothrix orenii]